MFGPRRGPNISRAKHSRPKHLKCSHGYAFFACTPNVCTGPLLADVCTSPLLGFHVIPPRFCSLRAPRMFVRVDFGRMFVRVSLFGSARPARPKHPSGETTIFGALRGGAARCFPPPDVCAAPLCGPKKPRGTNIGFWMFVRVSLFGEIASRVKPSWRLGSRGFFFLEKTWKSGQKRQKAYPYKHFCST